MKHKILIVEDNKFIRENFTEILELNGYEVFSAGDGATGLTIAKRQNPDLILCDIKIPVLDGYHLLQQIHKQPQFNKVLFIFATSACEKKDIEKGLQMGADDYIIKPFSAARLLYTLNQCFLKKELN